MISPQRIKLTPTEVKVARGLLRGDTLQEIRIRYDMSNSNVHNMASRMYAKCPSVTTAHQLVAKYYMNEIEFIDSQGRNV